MQQWSTRAVETAVAAGTGLVLAPAVLLVDPVGRWLVGAAALLLLAVAARDLLLRPRLAAGPDGVVVRTPTGRMAVAWDDLRVRVRDVRRLGVRTRTLELEDAADDTVLVVLGRRDLGVDPADVAAALARHGAPDQRS